MACQVNYKLGLSPVQWFFTIFLIAICFHAKPCTCSISSNQDRRRASYTWNTTFQQMNQGLLFHLRKDVDSITLQPGSLGYYMGNSSQIGFNLTDLGWFVIPKWFDPWRMSHGDDQRINLHEASFSIVFTLSAVSNDKLYFDILPRLEPSDDSGRIRPQSYEPVKIEKLDSTKFNSGRTIRVTTQFLGTEEDDPNPARYSVQIDYDRDARNLSVYLVRDGDVGTDMPAAGNDTMHLDAGDTLTPDALLFAITSSMRHLLRLHTWNFTIEVPVTEESQGPNTATIVSSVLGSAAATATIAAVVYFYLNSKYRRWKKDLDKLAKTMQSLPGVPMQVDFADIRKATNNFHETMRLGQGGFGTVYMCKLPAPKKGELMEVAVKKFNRRADNRGYEDFLTEVSIINRLRHKNIVPLVGKPPCAICFCVIICSCFVSMSEKM